MWPQANWLQVNVGWKKAVGQNPQAVERVYATAFAVIRGTGVKGRRRGASHSSQPSRSPHQGSAIDLHESHERTVVQLNQEGRNHKELHTFICDRTHAPGGSLVLIGINLCLILEKKNIVLSLWRDWTWTTLKPAVLLPSLLPLDARLYSQCVSGGSDV